MLPILRILPVGGVLLAILILALALSPPSGLNPASTLSARGALQKLVEHPEWRQFLLVAATRRADELNRLRDLPDMPQSTEKFAGLPNDRSDADPDDLTGTITVIPNATIPIEIGERSSTELPVVAPEERPPAIKTPERLKSPSESRRKVLRNARRAKPVPRVEPATFNLFEILFGGLQTKPAPKTGGSQQASQPAAVPTYPR